MIAPDTLSLAERVSRQEQFLAVINDALPALVAYVGADERYHFVNARYALWFKTTVEAIVGRHVSEVLGERAYASVRGHLATALGGQTVKFSAELDYGRGMVRWVEATYTPHRGPDGAVLGLVSLALDVTDRRRAEAERERAEAALGAALKRAEGERERFYAMLQGAPAIINVLRGPEHVFEFVNARFCELLPGGEAFLGKTVREAQPELAGTGFYELLDRVYRTGEPFRAAEAKAPIGRGGRVEEHYFSFVYQPVRDAEGDIEGVACFAFDVTESVLARREIEELAQREQAARRAAEEAGRTKDEFLSTLSHELRTPLNAILGWANLLRADALPEAQRGRALETVERNARVQARLIDDLLDLSRIVQGKLVLSVGPIEMARVVEAALDAVRPAADAKGVRLQPVLDSLATIVGDADRLQQVVWNLLANAIKFTPKGGRVQVLLRREGSHVEIVVADTGQGIAPDFLPHVFDRFRQADGSITRLSGGLGLGLAIVRSLVELHGGTVSVESDGPGTGATFVVRLPTAPLRADLAPPPAPDPSVRPATPFASHPGLKDVRVLVVDDEADTRGLIVDLLEQCGAAVRTAASAAEAFAVLRAGAFDVLVSDIGMPGEDGYALLRRVRALPAAEGGRVPALALTAYARSEDRTAALRAGFQAHVAKPVEAGELVAAIAALVGR
ncbi:MAG TPA: PAS domain-containing protein [Polyangiaceae bacterium]|nr:PAS domain-containing protein [Polyangiaceae bacterium]